VREQLTRFFASRWGIILVGAVIGVLAPLLQYWGNPPNMGICVACFERDIAGALGLHRAAVVQYLRPEIMGFVLGSTIAALVFREFNARTGSAPLVRYVLGVLAMIGALAFLGCPWRALLRLAGGDLNAVVGLIGLAIGIWIGVMFLKKGYSLGRSNVTYLAVGWIMPALMVGLLLLAIFQPQFSKGGPIFSSEDGPGALHAAIAISLVAGLVIGFVGITLQPVAHSSHLWNLLGMILAGLSFALAGGCPGRQLFLAGEGDSDAGVFVLGMITGAGIAHNFSLAGKPDAIVGDTLVVGGLSSYGQIAVLLGLAIALIIGFTMRERLDA